MTAAAAGTSGSPTACSPADDQRGYRRALGHFATGVTVVTAQAGSQLVGMTANSFSSVSLDPPLILWSIAKQSSSLPVFEQAGHFAVNVLAADQLDLASGFAKSGSDKFAGVAWLPGLGAAPCLSGVLATFECHKHQVIEAGDHLIVVGRVGSYRLFEHRDPLLFVRGRFTLSVDYPALAAETPEDGQAGAPADRGTDPPTMLGLLWDAFTGLSQRFQTERDALGLNSVTQGRVLSLLERHPEAPVSTIAHKAYISPQGLDEALQALQAAGYLTRTAAGACELSAKGREHVMARRKRAAAVEATQLKAFSAAELQTACRILRALGAAAPQTDAGNIPRP